MRLKMAVVLVWLIAFGARAADAPNEATGKPDASEPASSTMKTSKGRGD